MPAVFASALRAQKPAWRERELQNIKRGFCMIFVAERRWQQKYRCYACIVLKQQARRRESGAAGYARYQRRNAGAHRIILPTAQPRAMSRSGWRALRMKLYAGESTTLCQHYPSYHHLTLRAPLVHRLLRRGAARLYTVRSPRGTTSLSATTHNGMRPPFAHGSQRISMVALIFSWYRACLSHDDMVRCWCMAPCAHASKSW